MTPCATAATASRSARITCTTCAISVPSFYRQRPRLLPAADDDELLRPGPTGPRADPHAGDRRSPEPLRVMTWFAVRPAARFASVEDLLDDACSRLGSGSRRSRRAPWSITAPSWSTSARSGSGWSRAKYRARSSSSAITSSGGCIRHQPTRVPQARAGKQWIVLCAEGYTSSLAADALNSLGVAATDVVGGYAAWRAAGLPTVPGGTAADQVVGAP